MKIRVLGITTALMFSGAVTVSSAADKIQVASQVQGTEFIRDAIHGNLAEVKLGKLAQQKGQSDAVRSMGSMLEKHHSKANREATQVAQKLNVVPPGEPNAAQKATYDRLSKLSGAEFDQEFIAEAVSAHQKTIQKYEKEQERDNAAAAYAKKTLPDLRQHLEMAQALQSKQVPTS